MANKGGKGTIQSIVDKIGELLKQPLSDESYEVPTGKTVRRSKSVARRSMPKAAARKTKAKRATVARRSKAAAGMRKRTTVRRKKR